MPSETSIPHRPLPADAWVLTAITVLGALAPLRHFVSDRSLGPDEAALALNMIRLDVPGLVGPLGQSQIAPFGFLLLTKGIVTLFGNVDERTLRLLPLLASLALGPIVYQTAMLLRGRLTAIIASMLTVFAPSVIYYAAEFKPYAIDICATATLLWLAARCVDQPRSRRRVVELTAGSCLLITLSFSAILVAASLLSALALGRLRVMQTLDPVLVLACLPVAAMSGVTLWVAQPTAQTADFMHGYWQHAFLTFPPGGPSELKGALQLVTGAFDQALTDQALLLVLPAGVLALALWLPAAVGYGLALEGTLLLVFPWISAMAASRLGLYPLEGRLAVYLLPTITLGLGVTFSALADNKLRSFRMLLPAAFVGILLLNAGLVIRHSIQRAELAPVIREMSTQWQSGDRLYVHFWARHAMAYYRHRWGSDWRVVFVIGRNHGQDGAKYAEEIDAAGRDVKRLWAVFSHTSRTDWIVGRLPERWRVVKSIQRTGALAVLLERR